MEKNILGTGLKFPLELTPNGSLALLSSEDLIKQSIVDILTTPLGTRPFLPQYGSRIHLLRFEQNSNILKSLINTYIFEALQQEPRIQFKSIEIRQEYSKVFAKIFYTVVSTTKTDSLIVPFFDEVLN